MIKILLTLSILFVSSQASAQTNYGFESGSLSPWSYGGGTGSQSSTGYGGNGVGVSIVDGISNYSPTGGKTWNVTPYGNKMASIQPGGSGGTFDQMTSALGLSSQSNTEIKNMLNQQAAVSGGSGNPTNASWMYRTLSLTAGQTYTIAWQYLSTDYVPFNDGSIISLVHSTDPSKHGVVNNNNAQYALLGFTNPGTGNYSTGSYGSTGWQLAVFTVSESGDYVLGFGAFNLGDTILSPILLVDEQQGTTTLNGVAYAPIAPNEGSNAPTTPTSSLCCGGSSAAFDKNSGYVAKLNAFTSRTTADNKVYIEQIGNSNTIVVDQSGTYNNYFYYSGNGSSNNIDITQSGTGSTTANYIELHVTGNTNTINMQQTSTGGSKAVFATIVDNNNSLIVQQKDNGSHWAEISLGGGSKNVDITQQGSGNHMASVTLTGLPVDLSLTQSGSTQQYYSINFNCTTSGGCAKITVTQGQ